SVLPAVKSSIRCEPRAAIRIDRQAVPHDRTFGRFEPDDNIGFTVAEPDEFAEAPRDPDAFLLIGGKEMCVADDRDDRDVLFDAPAFDPNRMRAGWGDVGARRLDSVAVRRQSPDISVAIFGESTRRTYAGERPAVRARNRRKATVLIG